MSQISSSAKSNQIILRNRKRNKRYKLAIKRAIKKYLLNIKDDSQNGEGLEKIECTTSLSLVYKRIDKAVNKGVLHKNTAARKKARLAKILK
uniref:Small ribosomal subunit protein bS20c n=1 Tax=Alsidium seaforthii TaxID=2007182 RepID=A0A1Z1MDJ9_9FLOR|nr:ribosomal protein S20 [Bryothamnion seaforthii]ARW63942.1 ribosomal protein S20 [Bryothamnion seaforthii]